MSRLSHNLLQIYAGILPIFLIPSTITGIMTGVSTSLGIKQPLPFFCNMVGFTGIGMITGLTYPISFPLLSGYVIYQHIRCNVEKDK
jgi:uncharacterized membrane protein